MTRERIDALERLYWAVKRHSEVRQEVNGVIEGGREWVHDWSVRLTEAEQEIHVATEAIDLMMYREGVRAV